MEFQNITVFDRDALAALNQAVNPRSRKTSPTARLLRILLPLFLLGSAVLLSIIQGPDPMLMAGGALGVAALVWSLFSSQIQLWMSSRSIAKGSPTYQLDFGPEGYVITYTTPDGEQVCSDNMDYGTIGLACQVGDYFVLLVGKQQGYALRRDGFTRGSEAEFSAFLAQQLGRPVTVLDS